MSIFDFFKKKKTNKEPENREDSTILVNISDISPKLSVILGEEYFCKIELASLKGEKSFRLPARVWQNALKTESLQIEEEKNLAQTANMNMSGIDLEKQGDIAGAIKIYEENIALRVPATHAYNRLMILYHKAKDYENEARVIRIAIEVFTRENKKRLMQAVESYPESRNLIETGFESCSAVYGKEGMVIFNPYNTAKYQNRLDKLLAKSAVKQVL